MLRWYIGKCLNLRHVGATRKTASACEIIVQLCTNIAGRARCARVLIGGIALRIQSVACKWVFETYRGALCLAAIRSSRKYQLG